MNLRLSRRRETAPMQAEIVGWMGFLAYVALVYRLRRMLNRSQSDS